MIGLFFGDTDFPKSILKRLKKIKKKYLILDLSRKNILKRDNHTCQYCSTSSVPMTVDHIIPKQRGGEDTWYNLVAACVSCNTTKGSRTPIESQMRLKKKPRKPTIVLHLQKFVKQFQGTWRPYLFMQEKN